MRHRYKDRIELTYEANKRRLRLEGGLILAEMMNEALQEMNTAFHEALNRGELLEISGTREEMKGFLKRAAARHLQLESGDAS